MRLLVIHQNFPGQFAHLVRSWARRDGWEVYGLGRDTAPGLPGFDRLVRYRLARDVRVDQHQYLRQIEASTLHGQAAARAMLELRRRGFRPDAILAHPGWGESLFAKDVFPEARLVHFCEWYYAAEGADLGFDPEFPLHFDDRARVRIWNAQHALDLINCDAAVSPTHWQRSRFPAALQQKIVVQHEGIDADGLGPDRSAAFVLPSGQRLQAGDPVITYVARNLEPYRGFHVFMRALEQIQKADSRCQAVIVGGDDVSYSRRPVDADCWRSKMLAEVSVDPLRTHFLGRVPRASYVELLQVSAAHVYLTYPFVLSWSLLEAMACAAPIVASATAPVLEAIQDGVNGRLVEFGDPHAIARTVLETLHEDRAGVAARRAAAQRDAQRWRQTDALPRYEQLLWPPAARPAGSPPERVLSSAVRQRLCSLGDERRREIRLNEVLLAR